MRKVWRTCDIFGIPIDNHGNNMMIAMQKYVETMQFFKMKF